MSSPEAKVKYSSKVSYMWAALGARRNVILKGRRIEGHTTYGVRVFPSDGKVELRK